MCAGKFHAMPSLDAPRTSQIACHRDDPAELRAHLGGRVPHRRRQLLHTGVAGEQADYGDGGGRACAAAHRVRR